MNFPKTITRLFLLVCFMGYSNLCLYADGNQPIQTGDLSTLAERPIVREALTSHEQEVIQRALEITSANIGRTQPSTTSNFSETAKTTNELADSINQQLNTSFSQTLEEVQIPLQQQNSNPTPENLDLPTYSETNDFNSTITNPNPYFEYPSVSNQSGSKKKTEDIESLIDFISQGGTSLDPINPQDGTKNRSWSEALDLKLLELENARNETNIQIDEKSNEEVIVIDTVNFTPQIRGIYQLLNPPARLHPWLKWLLYSSRITPQMLEAYYSALRKRDQIYMLAAKGKGKLKIRYRGKVLDVPIFVWPEQAQGLYELVVVKGQKASEGKLEAPILPQI